MGQQTMKHVPGASFESVTTIYEWASLGDVQVVNVGGSRGQAAIELAKTFESIKVVIQDAPQTIQGAELSIPDNLKERVSFMPHSLFDLQTVKAPVYFFRMLFRGLGDNSAIKVLKAHIPVLEPGVKILIQDVCMPEPNTIPLWMERTARYVTRLLNNMNIANKILQGSGSSSAMLLQRS